MSKTRTGIMALLAVSALALAVHSPAQSVEQQDVKSNLYQESSDRLQMLVTTLTNPIVDLKEVACLAKNIFFEAGNQPVEGKVAVGLVTINRSNDPRFPNSVCKVINQKTSREIASEEVVVTKTFWDKKVETRTVWTTLTVCQFSWRCMMVKEPTKHDDRWVESQQVAMELLSNPDQYQELREKYQNALYFHNNQVKPVWAKQKQVVGRIGGHWFYAESNKNNK